MNWSVSFAPLVPLPVLIAIAVVAALLNLPSILRSMRGAPMKVA